MSSLIVYSPIWLEWAAGALAYEMFRQDHPFQDDTVDKGSYDVEDLPQLKGFVFQSLLLIITQTLAGIVFL